MTLTDPTGDPDLLAEVLGHLNAEAMVLQPEVRDVLGEPERRRLADESEALSALAATARRTRDFDLLAGALTDHRRLVDALLGRLRERAERPAWPVSATSTPTPPRRRRTPT